MPRIKSTSRAVICPVILILLFAFITMRPRLYEKHPETMRESPLPILEPTGIAFVEDFARRIDTESRTVVVEGLGGV